MERRMIVPHRRQFVHLAAGAGALLGLPRVAWSQAYPTRPVRLVVPYPPGGIQDAVGRPWAEKIAQVLEQPIIIENIGGAGGALGALAVARAQPDGYSILIGNSSVIVINPLASARLSYDPIRDFEPIYVVGLTSQAIAVNPSLPIKSLEQLVDYAKQNPGKLSYGHIGIGSLNHLTGELFKSLAGNIDIVQIPYRGAGPAISDAISGQIPMVVPAVSAQLLELHRSEKLRVLAITSPEQLPAAGDIPTAREAGLPGLVSQGFSAIFAPKGTPTAIIERLAHATQEVMGDASLQRIFTASGVEPNLVSSPQLTRQFIENEYVKWKPMVAAIGLKL